MRILQWIAGVMFWITVVVSVAQAQTTIPEERFVYTQDADFYGADLGPLFDTSRVACARACRAQDACTAFTFNTRSNACFPKSAVAETEFLRELCLPEKR